METRGESLAVTAVKDGVELIGVAWNEPGKPDKPRKLLVATCGTTLAGEPCCRTRYRNDPETGETTTFVREVPRCEDVETYTDYCGAIDRFNRDRQDGFRLERMIEELGEPMLTSFIGYVGTNAFKAAKLEGNASNMNDFMHTLALELLTNEYDGSKFPAALKKTQAGKLSAREFVGRERPREGQAPWTALYQEGMTLRHNFAKVGTLTAAQGGALRRGLAEFAAIPALTGIACPALSGHRGTLRMSAGLAVEQLHVVALPADPLSESRPLSAV
eukprot:CAMPEP_0206212504 /NCGR_PEP_ID=MMETSP0047_2-20121206/604_1 /ASSEMBLY_ACC=CAM_ASM_000192 /TAXON_ID=195065 /ORGANISM="Chroomonas mesostigmatica_cf, Strain CCMP1168" /LENGTH=273 /DNA_ID=CAMNT_0053634551 /DNA_START=587 /DNA_END=1408 /DNA_ORIENTATION=+